MNIDLKKQTTAEAIVSALEAQGVEHIFIGPPGEHVVELYDAILSSKKLRGYLTTNEYTLSFMADGYSRRSGKVGVFTSVPGPGITNALTGMVEAFLGSTPLVAIVSDVRSLIEESFQLHQIAHMPLLQSVVKAGFRITGPKDAADVIARAFRAAQDGEPGPVIVEIPCDIYTLHDQPEAPAAHIAEIKLPDQTKVEEITALIQKSKKLGLYVGRGCASAVAEIKSFVEQFQVPIATSISGRGTLPEDHPLSVGFGFGSNGSKIAEEVFGDCDTVLAIGCKFAEVSTGSYSFKIPPTLIHVDINPENLNRVFETPHTLVCDSKIFLQTLLTQLQGVKRAANPALQERIRRGKEDFERAILKVPMRKDGVDPGKFYQKLRKKMAREDTLTVDIGNHELWGISCYDVWAPRTFLCPTNFSAMGFAVPAAIAAQIAKPDQRAICCIGDGGFLMCGFEIATAVRNQLPVTFFVFNDGALGITQSLQKRFFKRPAFTDLAPFDYAAFAKSVGIAYLKIAQDDEVTAQLDSIFSSRKPLLVDLRVSYDEPSPYLKGIVRHRLKVMPKQEMFHLGTRMLKRTLFPPQKGQPQ